MLHTHLLRFTNKSLCKSRMTKVRAVLERHDGGIKLVNKTIPDLVSAGSPPFLPAKHPIANLCFSLLLLSPEGVRMVRQCRCANGLIPVPDLSVTPTIPCSLWEICNFVTHTTTSKTWARNTSAWARVLSSTLVTCFPRFSLSGLLSFVLFHPMFKPSEVYVSLRIGSSGAKFLLYLILLSILNLSFAYDVGYFHGLLVHFLKTITSISCYYLLHFPS